MNSRPSLFRCSKVATIAVLIAVIFPLLLGCQVSNYLYRDLDLPIDREAAITAGSVAPSSDIRAVIGGRGEGLDCSIPYPVEKLVFGVFRRGESPVSLQFRQACVFHDLCYRHGYATYGYAQTDCDFMLVQHAFRTCIQMYDLGLMLTFPSGPTTPEVCRERARQVLLGVRIGGRGSFQARERSSYYEFDPMPMHADNYMVGRLTKVEEGDAPVVDGNRLLSNLTIFRFKRGRIKIDHLKWDYNAGSGDHRDGNEKKPFPVDAVPTPPNVVRSAGKDRYIWLARSSDHDTAFNIKMSGPVPPWKPENFSQLKCPSRDDKPRPPCDVESSVMRIVQLPDRDPGVLSFLAFTHRFEDGLNEKKLPLYTVGLYLWDSSWDVIDGKAKGFLPTSSAKLARENVGDDAGTIPAYRYRFLQSEVHVGEFRKIGCQEAIALARGIHIGPNGSTNKTKSKTADDYKNVVAAGFFPLTPEKCPESELRQVWLPQAAEPAVPLRRGPGKTDELLTVRANGDSGPVKITEYEFGDGGSRKHKAEVPDSLDGSWVNSAAYVVRPYNANADSALGDRLFFSRARLDPDQKKLFENPDTKDGPQNARIEFRYFELSKAGWEERGYSSCKVDLDKQQNAKFGTNDLLLKGLYRRAALEGINEQTQPERFEKGEQLFSNMYRREMVRQWMQSQVIPGYIFEADTNDGQRPIDAVVVNHESPVYSLVLKGVRASAGKLDKFKVMRPSETGEVAFAHCD